LAPLRLNDSQHLQLASPRPTDTNPETLAFEYLAAGAHVTCKLLQVKYGTFKGEAAGLILFQTTFFFPAEASRTTSAKISVKFVRSDLSLPTKLPKIADYQPRLQNGTTTDSAIHDTFHINFTLQPPAPANVGSIDAGGSKEKSFTRMHHTIVRSDIIPHSKSTIGKQCLNTVVWALRENGVQKGGVPHTFKGAIIVLLPPSTEENPNSKFYAQFKIEPNQACEIKQLYASFLSKLNDKELACFDSKDDFRADGLLDPLEDNDLRELVKLPSIDVLPPGY
jgi:hypothetical protein